MKILIITALIILFSSFTTSVFADSSTNSFSGCFQKNSNTSGYMRNKIVRQLKEIINIKMEMRKIRIDTIQSDPQLEQTFEQIKVLADQLHKTLSAKLKYNSKYQTLKQQLKRMAKEFQIERKNMQEHE